VGSEQFFILDGCKGCVLTPLLHVRLRRQVTPFAGSTIVIRTQDFHRHRFERIQRDVPLQSSF
jgi:hypothetical protein